MLFKSFFLDNGVGFLNWHWENKKNIFTIKKKKNQPKKKKKKPTGQKIDITSR